MQTRFKKNRVSPYAYWRILALLVASHSACMHARWHLNDLCESFDRVWQFYFLHLSNTKHYCLSFYWHCLVIAQPMITNIFILWWEAILWWEVIKFMHGVHWKLFYPLQTRKNSIISNRSSSIKLHSRAFAYRASILYLGSSYWSSIISPTNTPPVSKILFDILPYTLFYCKK